MKQRQRAVKWVCMRVCVNDTDEGHSMNIQELASNTSAGHQTPSTWAMGLNDSRGRSSLDPQRYEYS